MNIVVGAKSDVGKMRNDNQDSYLADEPVFAVADGVGGHLGGDVASATAIRVIQEGTRDGPRPEQLEELLQRVNTAIWEKSQSAPHLRGMGTTCTLVLLDNGVAHLAHVGDSRAYLYRKGDLQQLTEDHNLVGRMLSEGRLSREEAAHHPQRNIITRALGLDRNVDIDLTTLEMRSGDRLIICSDGLSSMVDEDLLAEILSSESEPQVAADRLVEEANRAGGEDNITVVLIDSRDDGADSSPPPAVAPRTGTPTEPPASGDQGGRGWGRRLAWALVVIALLTAGAIWARWFVLGHAWFVGANATGVITIYKGIPDEVAGVSLKRSQQQTHLRLSSLPQFLRSNVSEGIKVDSYADAQTTVTNLRERIREFGPPTPSPSPSNPKKKS